MRSVAVLQIRMGRSHTLQVMNACFSFSGIALNHSMVLFVLFHRFTLVA